FRARQGAEPGRRLHREGAQGQASEEAARAARERGHRGSGRYRRVPPLRLCPQALSFPRRQRLRVLIMSEYQNIAPTPPRFSASFDEHTLAEIRRAAATGIYDIRGGGAKRRLPHFDDLLFLGASISRYPLEGYREKCGTNVVLGARHAKKPIELKIP